RVIVGVLLVRKLRDGAAQSRLYPLRLVAGVERRLRLGTRNSWNREGHDGLASFHRHLGIVSTGDGGFGRALGTAPQSNQSLVESSLVRCRGATSGNEPGSDHVLIPGELAADDLDPLARLAVSSRAGVLHPHARSLIVDADAVIRERARLAPHADGASGLELERG